MSDLFHAYPDGFQAEDAEHVPAKDPGTAAPAEGFQAEEGEHRSVTPEGPAGAGGAPSS
jgi:hypothetical protein